MTPVPSSRLSVTPPASQPLTAQQKKFNSLIRKIETQRQLLASWEKAIVPYRQKRRAAFAPLIGQLHATQRDFALFLDQAISEKGLSKTDRDTLSETICSLAAALIDGPDSGTHGDAMKALYNKHSGGDFDAEQQANQDAMRTALAQEFGFEPGNDADLSSPEAVLQRLQQHHEDAQAHAEQAREAQRTQRKKSARQTQLEAEQQQVGQSLREVYRKLASALHPDREPDPKEQDRKTALMKRVNMAYADKNLLDLLDLQFEVEQIDANAILNLGDDRLKRYNKLLTAQLSELQLETQTHEHAVKYELDLSPHQLLTPGSLLRHLQGQVDDLEDMVDDLKAQRRSLTDVKAIKRWLKQQRAGIRFFDDAMF